MVIVLLTIATAPIRSVCESPVLRSTDADTDNNSEERPDGTAALVSSSGCVSLGFASSPVVGQASRHVARDVSRFDRGSVLCGIAWLFGYSTVDTCPETRVETCGCIG
jgi:hypothetical protein